MFDSTSLFNPTALDLAGPLFKGDRAIPIIHDSIGEIKAKTEGGAYPWVAVETYAIYSDPGKLGTVHFDKAKVNIILNETDDNNDDETLPGTKGRRCNMKHVFAGYLAAAMSLRTTKCLYQTDDNKKIDLNFIYNREIPRGTYKIFIEKCFPYCCGEVLNKKIGTKTVK